MDEIGRAYTACIKLLAPRARSKKEIKDHLARKKFKDEVIQETLDQLTRENLINDKAFAEYFVENREQFRPRSKFALRYELRQKGIDEALINHALMDIDEGKSAWAAVKPRIEVWKRHDSDAFKKKIMNYLKNRGFNYEISISTYKKACSKVTPPFSIKNTDLPENED
ncbi:MAG: regulatory protein RecX [Desulfobacteraceae bacterium]